MPKRLLTADEFRAAAKDGGDLDGTVYRFSAADPQLVEGDDRSVEATMSDGKSDHSFDALNVNGWDKTVFEQNPVAPWAHDTTAPPIGKWSNVRVKNSALVGKLTFASPEVYEFSDLIFRLVKGGFLNAISVGFKPLEWSFTNDKDRPYGIDFKKMLLLEASVVPVPANPRALIEARSNGIDTALMVEWAEKVLDTGDTIFLPKAEVEALRVQAGAVQKRFYIQSDQHIGPEASARLRDAVKAWQDDPKEILILGPGVELKAAGDASALVDPDAGDIVAELEGLISADPEFEGVDATKLAKVVEKAGRRVSAATKATLAQAMGHHEETAKCIKSLMDDQDPDDGEGDDGDDGDQPDGTIVLESDQNLSPEEIRLREVRALREAPATV